MTPGIFKILSILLLLGLLSCNNSKSKSIEQINLTDSPVKIPKELPQEIVEQPVIDSSNLIRAFADIYFGISQRIVDKPDGGRDDILAGNRYSIGGYDFLVGTTEYSDQRGLYKFNLIGERKFLSYNELFKAIEEVHDLTLISYKSFKTISIIINPKLNALSFWKDLPSDAGENHFIREYSKEDLVLRLGYFISYRSDYGNTIENNRGYRLIYSFHRPSEEERVNRLKDQEATKKRLEDADQF